MKIEWLKTVIMVERYLSFSEAAFEIPCAQSSVSRHVQSVETELGVTIFKRAANSNSVEITDDGARILPLIHKLAEDYEELLIACDSTEKPRDLYIALRKSMFSSASKGKLISDFFMKYPRINPIINEYSRYSEFDALKAEKVDVLLFNKVSFTGELEALDIDESIFRIDYIGQNEMSIAISKDDPLAKQDRIRLSQLKEKVFINHTDILKEYKEGTADDRGKALVDCCLEEGFTPKFKLVSAHLADIKPGLAAQGQGVFPTTIPKMLRHHTDLTYLKLEKPPFYVQYFLISLKKNTNPAIRMLSNILHEGFENE